MLTHDVGQRDPEYQYLDSLYSMVQYFNNKKPAKKFLLTPRQLPKKEEAFNMHNTVLMLFNRTF
jgi:hypothetical protein